MFEPNKLPPEITYVERYDDYYANFGLKKTYKTRLESSIERIGFITIIVSNSKNGKSSLIKKTIPSKGIIEITAIDLEQENIYTAISKKIRVASNVKATDKLNISLFSKLIEADYEVDLKLEVIKEIKRQKLIILLDDFHYLDESTQTKLAYELKNLIESVKVIITTRPHLKYDLIAQNPDLNGRIDLIEIKPWKKEEILQIFNLGFANSQMHLSQELLDYCASKCLGSPLIAQELGYNLIDNFAEAEINEEAIEISLRISSGTFNHTNVLKAVSEETKGTITYYRLKDGETCQIVELLFIMMSIDPQRTEYSVDDFICISNTVLTDTGQINKDKILRGMARLEKEIDDKRLLEVENNVLYIFDITFLLFLKMRNN